MFIMCAVCTCTIKSQAFPKGDLQLTQCSHLGRVLLLLDVVIDDVLKALVLAIVLDEFEPWLVTVVEAATVDDCDDDGNCDDGILVQSVQGLPSFSSLRASHLQVNLSLQ